VGLLNLPSIVTVGFYFDKRRALANGIAICGTGIGTFVFAPLASFLVSQYGWKVGQTLFTHVFHRPETTVLRAAN